MQVQWHPKYVDFVVSPSETVQWVLVYSLGVVCRLPQYTGLITLCIEENELEDRKQGFYSAYKGCDEGESSGILENNVHLNRTHWPKAVLQGCSLPYSVNGGIRIGKSGPLHGLSSHLHQWNPSSFLIAGFSENKRLWACECVFHHWADFHSVWYCMDLSTL